MFMLPNRRVMQDIPTYNHSKPKDDPTDRVSMFYVAAKISLLGPILCALLLRGAEYGLKDTNSARLLLGLGAVTVVVNVVCFALGIFALGGILRYGMHGILVRAVLGILLSGLFLGLFGAGFVRGFQAALKQHQMIARARATSEQSGNGPDGEPASGSNSARGINLADKAANIPGGKPQNGLPADSATVAAALTNFQAGQQSLITAYDAAALAIKNPPVLSMKDIAQREQLIARKQLVNKFLDANEKWLGFSTKAEVTLREELVKLRATPATIDAGLKEYQQSIADRDFIQMRIRATDQRIGIASLDMLVILEANWGNWKYNAEKNTLAFSNSAAAAQYNDSFAEMNAAKDEQARLQNQLSHPTAESATVVKPSL
jgi:hypothetical protein